MGEGTNRKILQKLRRMELWLVTGGTGRVGGRCRDGKKCPQSGYFLSIIGQKNLMQYMREKVESSKILRTKVFKQLEDQNDQTESREGKTCRGSCCRKMRAQFWDILSLRSLLIISVKMWSQLLGIGDQKLEKRSRDRCAFRVIKIQRAFACKVMRIKGIMKGFIIK